MVPCTSSGLKTADAAIVARPCLLHGVVVIQASAGSDIKLYDNAASAAGTLLTELTIAVNSTSGSQMFNNPVECSNGIYADVSGSGAGYIVYYSLL